MSFIATATVVDLSGKPLPAVDARVCVYSVKTNTPRPVGAGRTDAQGKLTVECALSFPADVQPRLELQLARDGRFVPTGDAPAQFAETGCNFGKVVAAPPAATAAMTEPDRAPEAAIGELTGAIADELRATQARLRTERAGIRLERVSLQLKVLPGARVERVVLPRLLDIQKVGAAGLSLLNLDFAPDTSDGAPTTGPAVPRVLGYTEAMARRKLAEQRLLAEVVYQVVATDAEDGRVISQSPAAGASTEEGSAVVIAIGRRG